MTIADLDAAARHRDVAAGFADVVAGVTDWNAPTPVDGWVARDVVAHLVDWFTGFLAAGGVELPAGPTVADDPAGAWSAHASGVQALLDGPSAEDTFTHPMAGEHRLADAVDQFYTADVFMHTWDLARSQGLTPDLDAAFARRLLDGMASIDEMLRSSGQYGPKVEVPDDADVVSRLMGFIGRDPAWTPAPAG
ncbi:maleylpyruvate isomerase family mycothiol-dependent enzyme [Gordonia McavH-238-E]|uniref:maleylpyruvate isomerase family mycothiol-dependent enzyme n=1 Tax=Gordonia sp. McavH-238-E TaxID=2917736 RepID=UPI0007E2E576|nr:MULTISPECIES: maleylpyruvate isomerase family mycothiol-dependent enzyme [unclassified Gordonia (in: high G+C Gram-positive bacteria)]MCG7634277.1 maleylpyruvate isomerase family mycothiol-dependent enzyme [Gordonia sp. McavH-238-E]